MNGKAVSVKKQRKQVKISKKKYKRGKEQMEAQIHKFALLRAL